MSVVIPISKRARKYGYVIWPKKLDHDVRALLGDVETLIVVMDGRSLGEKRVDWRYRRISVGQSNTRDIDSGRSSFDLTAPVSGTLQVMSR